MTNNHDHHQQLQTAVLAGGCFWCLEAVYQRVTGVKQVTSGYAGGHLVDPSYEQVVAGETGHAEAVRIKFNPNEVSYQQLLDILWQIHDPTTLNQQGSDVGSQYRSVIFYLNPRQQEQAMQSKVALAESNQHLQPIVTSIQPLEKFYPAEEYHHHYYQQHPNQAYCQLVIEPKLKKLKKIENDLYNKT